MIKNLLFRCSLLLMSLLLLQGCTEDSDGVTAGKIWGTVRDEISGIFLNNCTVTVTPSNQSMTTDTDGKFEFTGLSSGKYELTFNRPGYEEKTILHNLILGLPKKLDISLQSMEGFSLSEKVLDFGDLENSKSFHLVNNSVAECTYSISEVPEWLELSTLQGEIGASSTAVINATVKREIVPYGNYNGRLTVTFKGAENAKLYLDLKMQKVEKSAPTVSIAGEPSKTSLYSITIKGTVTSTGGSKVTRHGHCWSTTANPTLDNDHSELGQREATGEFTSVLENLTPNTTYYIRSYAVNAQGVAYSQQIKATTDDAASDKWDGTKATEFSGGSGIMGDPYQITTGAQLNLVRDYNDAKFILMNNINLDKRAWEPISYFSGEFDGNGFTIFNLNVETSVYYNSGAALFYEVSGSTAIIKNLHINGVNIVNKDWDWIATLAAKLSGEATLENCTVTLNEHSKILGNSYVGGLVGAVYNSDGFIKSCKVTGINKEGVYQIIGNEEVGGIVGSCGRTVENCHVVCGVSGNQEIGGISGYCYNSRNLISTSSFTGRLLCEKQGGGICGNLNGDVRGCKVNANIKGTNVGGIAYNYNSSYGNVISSYYQGKFEGLGEGSGLILSYHFGNCYACYAIPEAGSTYETTFGGNINEDCASTVEYVKSPYTTATNTVGNCSNILEHFKSIGLDYQADWDFENVWEKETMVNGNMTTVKCPKLLWEK